MPLPDPRGCFPRWLAHFGAGCRPWTVKPLARPCVCCQGGRGARCARPRIRQTTCQRQRYQPREGWAASRGQGLRRTPKFMYISVVD